jgi:hypothetical protein
MAMGIDEEIQRRMDAYRGNPQALQQRYQMSQQLLDLLALQKLKSEKDSVARQMQAQMQQMPGTVAQQREQEMLGRTKNELLQQVGGTMRTQAARQQQNAARMAQAMARPQGGIAGLAPQSAQRMAGGGIVAFQQGGTEEDAKLRASVETALNLGASQEELADLLSRIGKSPEEFGLDALVPSPARQMAAAAAPGAEGLRIQRPSASSTLAAIEALPVSSAATPMPMRAADQLTQALARGPQVTPPKAGSLTAPPSEPGPRPEAGSLVGSPFEQRSQLKDQINARLEELDVRRFRVGSERFLPEERKQDIAEADRLRRNLAALQGGGNDPEKTAAAVRSVERNMVAGDVERVVDRARGDDRDIEALLADPMFAMAAAEKKPAAQKTAPQTPAAAPTTPAPAGQGIGPLLDAAPSRAAGRATLPTGENVATTALEAAGLPGKRTPTPIKVTPPPEGPTYTKGTAPDISIDAPQELGLDALRTAAQGTMTATEPSEEALLKKYGNMLGLGKLREVQEKGLAELAALDKAQLDPEKLRRERVLRKFAAAGAGRSMAQTGADVMLEQEKRERDRLRERMNIATEIEAAELGMNKDLLVQSLRTVDNAKNMKIKGMEMLRNLGRDEFERSKANAELQWNKFKEDNAERFREYTALSDAANRALRAAQVDESALSRLLNDIGTLYADEREAQRALLEQDQRYIDLVTEEERTPEQEAELRKMLSTADATALALVDKANLLDLQESLADRLLRRMGMDRQAQ